MILSLNIYKLPDNLPESLVVDPTKPDILRFYQERLKRNVPGEYIFLYCDCDSRRVWVLVTDSFEILQLMEFV